MTLKMAAPSLDGARDVDELAQRLQKYLDEMRRRLPNFEFVPLTEVNLGGAQAISNVTITKVDFDTVAIDNTLEFNQGVGQWDAANQRIAPVQAGAHLIVANVAFGAATTDSRIYIYKNGSVIRQGQGGVIGCNVVTVENVTLGDYFEVYAYQQTGGSTTILVNSTVTYFQVAKLR